MIIRKAEASDIGALSTIWYERMILLQQSHSFIKLSPENKNHWCHIASGWHYLDEYAFFVAEKSSQCIGFIVGRIEIGLLGMANQPVGYVLDLATDRHKSYPKLMSNLLNALKTWFIGQNVQQLTISVPLNAPLEQAFWRGAGAKIVSHTMWLKI